MNSARGFKSFDDRQNQCGKSAFAPATFEDQATTATPRSYSSGSELCSVPPHWSRRHAGAEYRKDRPSKGRLVHNFTKAVTEKVRQSLLPLANNIRESADDTNSNTSKFEPDFEDVARSFDRLLDDLRYTEYSPVNTFLVQQVKLLQEMYLDQDIFHNHGPRSSEDRSSQTGDSKIYARDLLTQTEQKQMQIERQNREILKKLDALSASNHGRVGKS